MNVHLPMRIGGWLAAQDIRLAYTASCLLGCVVCVIHTFFFHETLPRNRRVPFTWAGHSPLAFLRLFRRSHERGGGGRGGVTSCESNVTRLRVFRENLCRNRLSAKLNTVVVLQSMTNGMGDLWQVVALTPAPDHTHAHTRTRARAHTHTHMRARSQDALRHCRHRVR